MFTDITNDIEKMVPKKFEGLVNVYSPHTTCCIFQTENELLHLVDIRFFLDKLVNMSNAFEELAPDPA